MAGELLRPGQVVHTATSRRPCRVEQFLGGGGQGEVYRANLLGSQVALKWYFAPSATQQQWESLTKLIDRGPPGKSERFLWPIELVTAEGVPGYGYLMRLREARFKGLSDLVTNRIDPPFRVLITSALELVDSFFILHGAGLCYRDISFGNAFLDPRTGEVLVCDNDNVAANRTAVSGVLGTPDFMAPEIVRGDARPDRQTDLYSLAVLLFYMFHVHHPLHGKRMLGIRILDLAARNMLCGTHPLFIFDPKDASNAAVNDPHGGKNALKYWPLYPQFFRDAFLRSFTEGIRDPEHGRVREGEWREVLVRLRDSIYYCYCVQGSATGVENFFDADAFKQSGGKKPLCHQCGKEVSLPYRMRIGRSVVMLNNRTNLFPHHVDDGRPFDFSAPIAEVVPNPNNPQLWGLKNLTKEKWVATLADGSLKEIEPQRSVVLADHVHVSFGKVVGEIRY